MLHGFFKKYMYIDPFPLCRAKASSPASNTTTTPTVAQCLLHTWAIRPGILSYNAHVFYPTAPFFLPSAVQRASQKPVTKSFFSTDLWMS